MLEKVKSLEGFCGLVVMAVRGCRQAVRDDMKSGGQIMQDSGAPNDGAVCAEYSMAETVKLVKWGRN